jgi:tRNA dimethylallyltransferase
VALLTGRPLSWWQVKAKADGVMRPWYVRLTAPRAVLHRRIEERVRRMLDEGFVAEVRGVLDRGAAPDAAGLDGVGYREVVRHLAGELPEKELAAAIAGSTRRYAKRQETWFRHQLAGHLVVTLDTTEAPEVLAREIVQLWEERGD